MQDSRKILRTAAVLTLAVMLIFSACKKGGKNPGEPEYVTDENGVAILDNAGNKIPVPSATNPEYLTDANGKFVLDENGNKIPVPVATRVQQLTDENGVPLTDENGENVTIVLHENEVLVTDKNGTPIRDANGNVITVELSTNVVTLTNVNGENIYDENGEQKTSIQFVPQDADVPKTDTNGETVTDKHGNVETTKVTVPAPSEGASVTEIPMTDANNKPITKPNGEPVTYTQTVVTNPVRPGENTANWSSTFGGSGNDKFVDVAPLSDGGYVALMQSNSKDGSMQGVASDSATPIPVLIRYDKNGKIVWKQAISSNVGIIVSAIGTDKSDHIYISGYSQSRNLGVKAKGEYDALLYKFNAKGKQVWLQSFGGKGVDGFENMAVAPDGSVVVIGYSGSTDGDLAEFGRKPGESSSILVKYTPDGKKQFVKTIGVRGDSLTNVAIGQDGSIFAVGNFSSKEKNSPFQSKGRSDGGVFKFSANGNLLWKQSFGGEQIENFFAVAPTPEGGCVVVGRSNSDLFDYPNLTNQGGYDAIMIEYKADGKMGFQNAFRGFYDDCFTDIVPTAEGYTVVGYSNSGNRDFKPLGNRGSFDGFILTVDARGTTTSAQGFGGSSDDRFTGLCILADKSVVACGTTRSLDGDLVGARYPNGDTQKTLGMIAKFG